MTTWERQLDGLVFKEQIRELFEMMFEDWMNDEDKDECIQEVLSACGTTALQMDEMIQVGVDNGVSAEMQIGLARSAFKKEGLIP